MLHPKGDKGVHKLNEKKKKKSIIKQEESLFIILARLDIFFL